MTKRSVFGAAACALWVMATAGVSHAGTIFVSSLSGDQERPDPVTTDGTGNATAELTGSAGSYVLSYHVGYEGLASPAQAAHIHFATRPPGADPGEQTGDIVHHLELPSDAQSLAARLSLVALPLNDGTYAGDWRFDDAELPLTDALVDSLFDGELYFNIHTADFPAGEIRGPIVMGAASVPLPVGLLTGLTGLGTAGWAMRRRRRRAA